MNTDVKQKWLSALRSGDYQQTKGYLHVVTPDEVGQPVGYCCLGVLCELAVLDGIIPPSHVEEEYGVGVYDGKDSHLPVRVMEWAGLERREGLFINDKSLVLYNDGDDYETRARTFFEIADLIEQFG